tara:strand:+ start:872 stop:1327 length:456 start_codon:yes stop_codon:yes gene_type:complete
MKIISIQQKVSLIYLGVGFFIVLAFLPWVLPHHQAEYSIKIFILYSCIIIAFISGSIWLYEDINVSRVKDLIAILFSLMSLSGALIVDHNLLIALIINVAALNLILVFELRYFSDQPEHHDYYKARKLATYLVTILFMIQAAYLLNPYIIS